MCTGEECVFCSFGMECSEYICEVRQSSMSLKALISLLIFFLDDLSISVRGGARVPYYYCIIVNVFLYIGY